MLKIEIGSDENKIHVEATGRANEILTELAISFNILYHNMAQSSPEEAGNIKAMLKFAIMDDNSPFWKDLHLPGEGTAVAIKVPQ